MESEDMESEDIHRLSQQNCFHGIAESEESEDIHRLLQQNHFHHSHKKFMEGARVLFGDGCS